jgi:hypothetical protein
VASTTLAFFAVYFQGIKAVRDLHSLHNWIKGSVCHHLGIYVRIKPG